MTTAMGVHSSWESAALDLLAALQDGAVTPAEGLPVAALKPLDRVLPYDWVSHFGITTAGTLGEPWVIHGTGAPMTRAAFEMHLADCGVCRDPALSADSWGVASTVGRSASRPLPTRGSPSGTTPTGYVHHADEEVLVVELPGQTPHGARLAVGRRHGRFSSDERLRLGLLLPHLTAAWQPVTALPQQHITRRQREVLDLVAEGCTNAEIGARLTLSTGTVRKHLDNIFEQLHVSTRAAAAARFRMLAVPPLS